MNSLQLLFWGQPRCDDRSRHNNLLNVKVTSDKNVFDVIASIYFLVFQVHIVKLHASLMI